MSDTWESRVLCFLAGAVVVIFAWLWDTNMNPQPKEEPIVRSVPNTEYVPVVVQGHQVVDKLFLAHTEVFVSAHGRDEYNKLSTESLDKTYPWPVRVLIVRDP